MHTVAALIGKVAIIVGSDLVPELITAIKLAPAYAPL
jgi:hypothetical protein